MDRWFAALAMVGAGGFVAMQAPINSTLGKSVGTFAAASVSFAVGLAVLVAITLLFARRLRRHRQGRRPALVLPDRRPARGGLRDDGARLRAYARGGRGHGGDDRRPADAGGDDRQLGWFGVEERALSLSRVIGLLLLAAGVFLIVAKD